MFEDKILCYDGHYIWFHDKPEIKVYASYTSRVYCDVNNPDIEITNVDELKKKYMHS